MAAKKTNNDEQIEETVEATPPVSFELPQKKISFEQFVTLHAIKPHHVGGFRAHVADADYPRTYEEWVAVLKTY